MTPLLIAWSGPLEGLAFPIDAVPLSVGRHASNRLVLRDIAVSRQHVVLDQDSDGYIIRDLDSRHGTTVNDQQIHEYRLEHGDRIGLGASTIVYLAHLSELPDGSSVSLNDSTWRTASTLVLDTATVSDGDPSTLVTDGPRTDEIVRRLGALLDATLHLGSAASLEALASCLMTSALDGIAAERAALLLRDTSSGDLDLVFTRPEQTMSLSRSVTTRVLHQRVALLANEILEHTTLGKAESLKAAQVSSVLCVPLLDVGRQARQALGLLYLDDRRPGASFSELDLRMATALAHAAVPALRSLRRLAWSEAERQRLQAETLDHDMVGSSPALQRVVTMISRVARTNTTVLIRGESGTGKELAAQAIHRASDRRERPFVAINCATLSDQLLESELFGHERGAFTGAVARKTGKLETAHTGTVFLDEVGELPITTQAKLLRVLQQRAFERVGGSRLIEVDVRVIAATNRDLEVAMRDGGFRQDLFYRLDVVTITMPALRDRRTDIPSLANHFANLHAYRLKRSVPRFSDRAQEYLQRYDWPGNIRELANAIERALVLAEGDTIGSEDLPEALLESVAPVEGAAEAAGYHDSVRETKKRLIVDAVREADGNISAAARSLGLHPNYLHRLIKNFGLRTDLA